LSKKVRLPEGGWRFVFLDRAGSRYVWGSWPGYYLPNGGEGRNRRRESAGDTPSQVLEARRRKRNELMGEIVSGASRVSPVDATQVCIRVTDAARLFAQHVRTHSPSKPRTLERYQEVLGHFQRILLALPRFARNKQTWLAPSWRNSFTNSREILLTSILSAQLEFIPGPSEAEFDQINKSEGENHFFVKVEVRGINS
jgi:hypothetical protein